MITVIDNLLSAQEIAQFRKHLDSAQWLDGGATAGSLSGAVKQNRQLDEQSDIAVSLGNRILRTLGNHPLFISAALPQKIYPPRFNRYSGGEHYGIHVDSAVMHVGDTGITVRSDLSATLFLCEPQDYEGGELAIETPFGAQRVKLPAGSMVLYPSSSLHQVTAVTAGTRTCAFFWIQSLVQDEGERTLLFDLDQSIQALSAGADRENRDILRLTGVYHNLLRRWAIT